MESEATLEGSKSLLKKTMTSHERVVAALNHKTPDRVPIDLGGFQSGIHKEAYKALIDCMGIKEEIEILDPIQQLAKPSEAVLRYLNVDIRYVCAHATKNSKNKIEKNVRDGRLWHDLQDDFGVVWSMPDDQGMYMDISHHPLAEAKVNDLCDYPWPNGKDWSRFSGVRKQALEMRKETPYALSTGIGGVVYEYCWYLRGLEQWLMDTIQNIEFCEALIDQTLKFWLDYYSGFMKEVGDIVDIVMIGDDIAGQTGPLFSPDFYRKVVKPRQKKLIQHIKSMTSAKIWYHTCGSCIEYIPDLIDNGVDIINPVQTSATGMDPAKLKADFGDSIVFWGGGIDSQHVLPFATPEKVREEVKRNLEIFKPNGGYIFNNIHNIQAGVPGENIIAMYEAAHEFGDYNGEF
jgi:uroporphyrinogen decarboxylase